MRIEKKPSAKEMEVYEEKIKSEHFIFFFLPLRPYDDRTCFSA